VILLLLLLQGLLLKAMSWNQRVVNRNPTLAREETTMMMVRNYTVILELLGYPLKLTHTTLAMSRTLGVIGQLLRR
jgi:hypothetical protein